jgi:hypothetical protein
MNECAICQGLIYAWEAHAFLQKLGDSGDGELWVVVRREDADVAVHADCFWRGEPVYAGRRPL